MKIFWYLQFRVHVGYSGFVGLVVSHVVSHSHCIAKADLVLPAFTSMCHQLWLAQCLGWSQCFMHAGQVPSQRSSVPAPALVFILCYFLQEPLDNEHPFPIILITYANNDQGTHSKSSLATEEKGHYKPFLMFSTTHAQGRKRYLPWERRRWLGDGDHAAHLPSRQARECSTQPCFPHEREGALTTPVPAVGRS